MAADAGDLVGHAQLAYDWRNGSARIGRVAIAPAFRGRGLAKPMLRLIMAEAFANPGDRAPRALRHRLQRAGHPHL